jgi:hypothetical protein
MVALISMVNTNVRLVYKLYSDINPGINMNMKIPYQSGMVCSLHYN